MKKYVAYYPSMRKWYVRLLNKHNEVARSILPEHEKVMVSHLIVSDYLAAQPTSGVEPIPVIVCTFRDR